MYVCVSFCLKLKDQMLRSRGYQVRTMCMVDGRLAGRGSVCRYDYIGFLVVVNVGCAADDGDEVDSCE